MLNVGELKKLLQNIPDDVGLAISHKGHFEEQDVKDWLRITGVWQTEVTTVLVAERKASQK